MDKTLFIEAMQLLQTEFPELLVTSDSKEDEEAPLHYDENMQEELYKIYNSLETAVSHSLWNYGRMANNADAIACFDPFDAGIQKLIDYCRKERQVLETKSKSEPTTSYTHSMYWQAIYAIVLAKTMARFLFTSKKESDAIREFFYFKPVFHMAECSEFGIDTPQNLKNAVKQYQTLAYAGYQEAIEKLKLLNRERKIDITVFDLPFAPFSINDCIAILLEDSTHSPEAAYYLAQLYEKKIGVQEHKRDSESKNAETILNLYTQASNEGLGKAQYKIGQHYESKKDLDKAVSFYNAAMQAEVAIAFHRMGFLHFHGLVSFESFSSSIPRNIKKAYHYFQEASDRGLEQARLFVWHIETMGEGVKRIDKNLIMDRGPICLNPSRFFLEEENSVIDYHEGYVGNIFYRGNELINSNSEDQMQRAILYFTDGAKLGCTASMNALGLCYQEGRGVPKNYPKAVEYYQQSADCLNALGFYRLGYCYQNGLGIGKDLKHAKDCYENAYVQGNVAAIPALADLASDRYDKDEDSAKDAHEAIRYFELAMKNHVIVVSVQDRAYREANAYEAMDPDYNQSISKKHFQNKIKAIQRTLNLAQELYLEATAYHTGRLLNGQQIKPNLCEAFRLYNLAANTRTGHGLAQFNLARMYHTGTHNTRSDNTETKQEPALDLAIQHYGLAAQQGVHKASYHLGQFCEASKNYCQAFEYYEAYLQVEKLNKGVETFDSKSNEDVIQKLVDKIKQSKLMETQKEVLVVFNPQYGSHALRFSRLVAEYACDIQASSQNAPNKSKCVVM